MSSERQFKAVVVGATGITGRHLTERLQKDRRFEEVVGVSRRQLKSEGKATHVSVDLLDAKAASEKLRQITGVTHIFFTAWVLQGSETEQVKTNTQLLKNCIVPLEEANLDTLQRIVLQTGTKYYGCHLGPYKTPSKENDPRLDAPIFYYPQEDFLQKLQTGKPWKWNVVRPSDIIGIVQGNYMSLGTSVAAFLAIQRELGAPKVTFPGKPGAFEALWDCTDVGLLSEFILWAATTDAAANHAFNCVNGDTYRWKNIWPQLCAFWGLAADTHPPKQQAKMADVMPQQEGVWKGMKKKYGLQDLALDKLATWWFMDAEFARDWDVLADMSKARAMGFTGYACTTESYLGVFRTMQEQRLLPNFDKERALEE